MAKTQTGSQKPGLTRGKAVLIGVLALVLVGVLYVQYGRIAGDGEEAALDSGTTRVSARRPTRSTEVKPGEITVDAEDDTQTALLEFDQAKWKSPELSNVIAYDPFALPAGFPQPSASGRLNVAEDDAATAEEKSKQLADSLAELRMQLDELKERGVHVIIGQKGQYVAIVGDRMVHVGDEIGNGFIVTEIDPKDGVVVDWKSPE